MSPFSLSGTPADGMFKFHKIFTNFPDLFLFYILAFLSDTESFLKFLFQSLRWMSLLFHFQSSSFFSERSFWEYTVPSS